MSKLEKIDVEALIENAFKFIPTSSRPIIKKYRNPIGSNTGLRPPIEMCEKILPPYASMTIEAYYDFWGRGEWKNFLGCELSAKEPKNKLLMEEGIELKYSPKLRALAAKYLPELTRLPLRKRDRYWQGKTKEGHRVRAYLDNPLTLWFFYGHGECTGLNDEEMPPNIDRRSRHGKD